MFAEAELLPLAGLQHLAFCERQWGLIVLEQIWNDNLLTVRGSLLHERAHEGTSEMRDGVRIARAVRLRSLRLGLAGVADVVEFHPVEQSECDDPALQPPRTVALPGQSGRWRPFPVEYKLGQPKPDDCDRVQLCAQAICLEEMLQVRVEAGAIFYGRPRRRELVTFDERLRQKTESLAERMHALFAVGQTPAGVFEKKCKSCSLFEICRPQSIHHDRSAARFLARAVDEATNDLGNSDGL